MADDPREGPVKPRMRHPLARDPVVGDAIAVGADQGRGRAHDLADVLFGDRGDQHARRTLVLDQIVADDVDRVAAARRGELADRLPGVLRQMRRDRDLHAVPGRDAAPIVEPVALDLGADALAGFRQRETRQHRLQPTRLNPLRQQVLERVAAGRVGVGVAIDGEALGRAASIIARICAAFPQLSSPEHLRCTISTWTPQVRAMSIASSTAATTLFDSSRIWVK